jgi:hypothetical protein
VTIRPAPPKITLDRVRPTVVRRRVFENPPATAAGGGFVPERDDEDSGPPSSVNVARALASLRGHELRRLDEILTHDDEVAPPAARQPPASPPPPPVPAVPTVRVGPSIALIELARRMSITQEELVTALVTRGFFDVTVKATLHRETARAAASMFGWQAEDTDEAPHVPEKVKPAKAKAKPAKAKAKPERAKAKPEKAKPAKAKTSKPAPKANKVAPKAATKASKSTKPKARPATSSRRTSRRG